MLLAVKIGDKHASHCPVSYAGAYMTTAECLILKKGKTTKNLYHKF